jgi:flagellar hook-associated protein 3 FlgL
MRISTQLMFDQGIASLQGQQSALLKLQQQLAAQKRVLTPSDDPVASARAVVVRQAKAGSDQYARNIDAAKSNLQELESVLGRMSSLVTDVKVVAGSAANGTLTDGDRAALAQELRGKFHELLGLANSRDGAGSYLFGGFSEASAPFGGSLGDIDYRGDAGQREAPVSASRQLPVTMSGAQLLQTIKNGNGTFTTAAGNGNTGTGVVDSGRVADPGAWSAHDYEIRFNVSAGTTTYDVVDTTTNAVLTSGAAFTSGGKIGVAGAEVAVTGAPANGDRFTLAPSANQSVFDTLSNLVAALEAPAGTATGTAALNNALNRTYADLDQAHGHLLSARASVGAWQREAEDLSALNEDQGVAHAAELSQLEDLDVAKAISDFSRVMNGLEAAQRSYAEINKLSLFRFI